MSTAGANYPGVPQPEEFVKAVNVKEQVLVNRPEHQIFSLAMVGGGRVHGAAHPYDYPWSELNSATVVDVGGGVGGFLIQLSHLYPSLKFVLQDRGPILKIAESEVWPQENNLALSQKRVKFMEHDFFQPNPVHGAEVYWLRSILHDWSDEYCIQILSNIASVMSPEISRILICDQLMISTLPSPDPAIPSALSPLAANYGVSVRYSHQRDLCMMGIINGIEPTPDQLRAIVEKSGLRIERVWECRSQVPIVEVRLAAGDESQKGNDHSGYKLHVTS